MRDDTEATRFVKVARAGAVRAGTLHCVAIDGRRLLLANVDGRFYAADDTCTHEDASLCKGSLRGTYVKCPLHGSRFDLRTGEPAEEPARTPLRLYPVRVHDGEVFVALPVGAKEDA